MQTSRGSGAWRGGRGRGGREAGAVAGAKRPRVGAETGGEREQHGPARPRRRAEAATAKKRNVVVILSNAGLWLGRDGLVDPYDKAITTEIANESLVDTRPDIVHQCLLALFDSDLAAAGRLQVFIDTTKGKAIRVSPTMRPPRTYHRFKGLMEALLRDGRIVAESGEVLMSIMKGSVVPVIPHGAPVVGLCNDSSAPIVTSRAGAARAVASPISDTLQGGEKHLYGIYVVPCNERLDLSEVDYVTEFRCPSAFPLAAHVACSRVCEGFRHVVVPPPSMM